MSSKLQEILRRKIRLKFIKSLSYLLILTFYLAIGAIIFHFAEYDPRQHKIQQAIEELEENRADLLKVLWGATIAKNEDDWTLIANERLDMYENQLGKYIASQVDIEKPVETQNPWDYIGSFFYCFITVSTIGYGNMVPETEFGKIFTILYSIIGIPLTLIVLSELGKCLTLGLKYAVKKAQPSSLDDSEEFNFGPLLALVLTFIFIFTGAAIFSLSEDWDLLDSMYFTWITFSTIGFGDFVPEHREYLIFAMLYVFTALTLCSMCFYSVQQWAEVYVDAIQSSSRCFLSKKFGWKLDDDDLSKLHHEERPSRSSQDSLLAPDPVAGSGLRQRIHLKKLTENSEEVEVEEEEIEEEEEE